MKRVDRSEDHLLVAGCLIRAFDVCKDASHTCWWYVEIGREGS